MGRSRSDSSGRCSNQAREFVMRSAVWTAFLIVVGLAATSARAGDAWHLEFDEGRLAAKAGRTC